jgi:hypothetical protein
MGLEQSDGFLNHAKVRVAPQRQWQDQEQPLELADFPALAAALVSRRRRPT